MSRILKSVLFEKSSPIIIKHRPAVEQVIEMPPQALSTESSLDEVRNEANNILALAQTSADRCLAEAELQAQELAKQAQESASQAREEASAQGYQEGFTQGNQAALSEMQQTIQLAVEKAERIVKLAEQEACQMVIDAERQIIEIALAVASKVLAREIEENPITILPIVKEALGKVKDQDHIVIRVNPEDYEMVLMAKRDLQLMVGREHAVSVAADHIVPIGGCIIDTALGTVDAKLDTKLEMVHKAIQETLP